MLTRLRRLLAVVDRLIVTADRHPTGARCLVQLASLGCAAGRLAVLYAALELVRSAVALAAG
ncbi:hypothetical protein [Burkholderia gladioli]